MLIRKDLEILRQEIKTGFAESESRIKSEINRLIIWIIATMFGAGALFITIAKLFFDKIKSPKNHNQKSINGIKPKFSKG